jgi:hypothetical protein
MADASSEVETQSMENVMPTIRWWILAFLLTMLWPTMVRANDDAFFERKIRPILAGTWLGGARRPSVPPTFHRPFDASVEVTVPERVCQAETVCLWFFAQR